MLTYELVIYRIFPLEVHWTPPDFIKVLRNSHQLPVKSIGLPLDFHWKIVEVNVRLLTLIRFHWNSTGLPLDFHWIPLESTGICGGQESIESTL